MEESAFMRQLARFPRVRDASYVEAHSKPPRAGGSGASRAALAPAPATQASTSGGAAGVPGGRVGDGGATLQYVDFWSGLEAVLTQLAPDAEHARALIAHVEDEHAAAIELCTTDDIADVGVCVRATLDREAAALTQTQAQTR